MQLISWNVNGIRAIDRKGFLNWFKKLSPDIICLQEIKALPNQIPLYLRNIPGYYIYWNSAIRKGYSGVGIYSKIKPIKVNNSFNINKFDIEGRILVLEFNEYVLLNIYFPNGKKNNERLSYKLEFYDTFLEYADKIKSNGKNIVVCGDFNTAHKEVDLARPKENEKRSGFLPIERAWIDKFIDHGYVDTFRYFNKNPNQYSWWDYKTAARNRNVGWRIDYFFVNKEFLSNVKHSFIMSDVMGSDHCPIGIQLEI